MNLRIEHDAIERLVAWAQDEPRVRALLLIGSRARPHGPVDAVSDFDIVVVASELDAFRGPDTAWLERAGGPILVHLDPQPSARLEVGFNRLVIYADGTKIDYDVRPLEFLASAAGSRHASEELDDGFRVLLDKDTLSLRVPAPSGHAHVPSKPTYEEYLALVEEFWWETTYVAKNLWRGELFPAKYSVETVIRFELLLPLLEWRAELDNSWTLRPGRLGRGLAKHLDAETWGEVERTFVGADVDDNWRALEATTALFRRVAHDVGDALGFPYPDDLDSRVSAYLATIRGTPG